MIVSLPVSHLECAVTFDSMTAKEKKISAAFMIFFEKRLMDLHQTTFPCIQLIAKMAGCCTKTVNTYIKKYENVTIKHKRRKNQQTKKNDSNLYQFNEYFFEFLILLKTNNLLYRWKKIGFGIIKNISEEDDFLCRYLYEKGQLSTDKLRTGFLSKLRSINSYLHKIHINTVQLPVPSTNDIKERRGFGVLQGLPLSFNEMVKLSNKFGHDPLLQAKKDFDWYGRLRVDNPMGFMYARAKVYTQKQFEFRI